MKKSKNLNLIDTETDELARVIEKAMVSNLLSKLAGSTFDFEDMKKFFSTLGNESDRAVAIVSFAYIDDKMKELMKREINPHIIGGHDALFESFGPLYGSSARIKIAAAMYWISPIVCHGLEILRKIRNEFAHRPFLNGFEDEKIISYLNSLKELFPGLEKKMWKASSLKDLKTSSKRTLFLIRAVLICQGMISQLLSVPTALRLGVCPSAVLGPKVGYRKRPKILKDALSSAAEIIRILLKNELNRATSAGSFLGRIPI